MVERLALETRGTGQSAHFVLKTDQSKLSALPGTKAGRSKMVVFGAKRTSHSITLARRMLGHEFAQLAASTEDETALNAAGAMPLAVA
jgi:hypothetical protein